MSDIKIHIVKEYSNTLLFRLSQTLAELHPRAEAIPISKESIETIINVSDKALFVAEIDDKIVGTATLNTIYGLTNDKAWLRDFVVGKDDRRKGVGSALWQAIIEWCKDRDLDLLFSTNQDNIEAQHFYEKHKAKKLPTDLYFYKIV